MSPHAVHTALPEFSRTAGQAVTFAERGARGIPRESAVAPAHLLAGVGICWLALGFLENSYYVTEVSPRAFQFAVLSIVFWLAVGLRWSRRLRAESASPAHEHVLCESHSAGAVQRGESSTPVSGRSRRTRTAAVSCVASAVIAFLSPEVAQVAHAVERWAMTQVLWMAGPLLAMDALLIFAAAALFVAPGYLIGALLRAHGRPATCPVRLIGGLLCGFAVACACLGALSATDCDFQSVTRWAALPLLLALIPIARANYGQRARLWRTGPAEEIAEPEVPDHWPTVLRLALGMIVMAAASAAFLWRYTAQVVFHGGAAAGYLAGFIVAAAAAVGLVRAGGRSAEGGSVAWCGTHCAAAGAHLAAGVAGFALIGLSGYEALGSSPIYQLFWIACAALPMRAMGRAVGVAANIILRRVSNDANHAVQLVEGVLIAVACGVGLIVIPMLNLLGSYAALVAVALCLVATGGVLLIHDPARDGDGRGRRILAVFASVIAMTILLPLTGAGWLRQPDHSPNRTTRVESWWGIYSSAQRRGRTASDESVAEVSPDSFVPAIERALALRQRDRASLRTTLVSAAQLQDVGLDDNWLRPCMCLLLDPSRSQRLADADGATTRGSADSCLTLQPALRFLRSTPDRHDLLVLSFLGLPDETSCRLLRAGTIDLGFDQLTPDGVLAVFVPQGRALALCMRQYPVTSDGEGGRWFAWMASWIGRRPGGMLICARRADLVTACVGSARDGSIVAARTVGSVPDRAASGVAVSPGRESPAQ